MAKLILGVWQDKLIDNRNIDESSIEDTFPQLQEFEAGNPVRAFIGWDGFFIFDPDVPVVDMTRAYVEKVQEESCGYCTPCRAGTRIVADRLKKIAGGLGTKEDLLTIRRLAHVIRDTSLCELGHTSMNALLKLMELMPDKFNEPVLNRQPAKRGVYHSIATAPCIEACPAHLDIPSYIDAIKSGNYYESLAIIARRNPLAGICGRVCVRPCEFSCRRSQMDDPVSIKYLKRFVNDQILSYAAARLKPAKAALLTSGKKVAVIGAGPCGLTAAFYLRQKGHMVEVFEELEEPGGMSAIGIPDYRLPRNVISAEVRRMEETGVKFTYGMRIGRDRTLKDLHETYDAVLIAIGAHGNKNIGMSGEEEKPAGYIPGIKFLRDINILHPIGKFERPEGNHAVIVGGGNVAMDCARSAKRLGYPKVSVIYRRTEAEMPADHEEVCDAKLEGIEFLFLTHPKRLEINNSRVAGLTCVRMELSEPDASGRRSPVEIKGSDFLVECDIVIPAIGQVTDFSLFTEDFPIETTKWGTIKIDEETMMTNREGIFSGGDSVSGPKALIDAMSQGLYVAHCIDQYLRGEKIKMPESERIFRLLKTMDLPEPPVDRVGKKPRCPLSTRPVEERISDFNEIEYGYSPEEAIREAERCLRCYRIAMFVTEK
ncbi:FAD-dependent oxidoreductase [bacterium]|nr:FAD-dependent oxidoreductase [bacterium]